MSKHCFITTLRLLCPYSCTSCTHSRKALPVLPRPASLSPSCYYPPQVKIETLNANLVGTDSHKNRLTTPATTAGVKEITSYKDWKTKLINLDNEHLANMNEIIRLNTLADVSTTLPTKPHPTPITLPPPHLVPNAPIVITTISIATFNAPKGCLRIA